MSVCIPIAEASIFEYPDAGKLHVGICAGGHGVTRVPTATPRYKNQQFFHNENIFFMHPKFEHHFSSLKDELKAKHKKSKGLESPTDIGKVREGFYSAFLKGFLPADILLASGEVIDSFGAKAKSGQQDILIYDPKVMRLNMDDGVQIMLVESCLAVIEVKSTLDKEEFFKALNKCREFKSLEFSLFPLLPSETNLGYTVIDSSFIEQTNKRIHLFQPTIDTFIKPKFYIFAYDGPVQIETLRGWIDEYLGKHSNYEDNIRLFPDLVCLLDTGIVYKNDGFAFKLKPLVSGVSENKIIIPNDLVFIQDNKNELSLFAFHLLEAVRLEQRNNRLQALQLSLNFRKYFLLEGVIQEAEIIRDIPEDMAGNNLAGANLAGVDFSNKDLTMANLSMADLTEANLENSFLGGTNFYGANLTRANLCNSNLIKANLCSANLTGAFLKGVNLTNIEYDEKTIWPDGFSPKTH